MARTDWHVPQYLRRRATLRSDLHDHRADRWRPPERGPGDRPWRLLGRRARRNLYAELRQADAAGHIQRDHLFVDGALLASDIDWTAYFAGFPDASGETASTISSGSTVLQMDFSTPVRRVGMLVGTSLPTTFLMKAFDDDLNADRRRIGGPAPLAARRRSSGLEAPVNVRRVVITEAGTTPSLVIDDIRYESDPTRRPLRMPARTRVSMPAARCS